MSYFQNDSHALYTGWVIGLASRHGLAVEPVMDEQGDYLPEMRLQLGAVTLTLVIPTPARDWRP